MTSVAPRLSRGLLWILLATAIAGALGYAIQLMAPALLPDAQAYVVFSVFWSSLHLAVAGISGVQQEVTRAVRPAVEGGGAVVLKRYGAIAACALLAVSAGFAFALAPLLFADDSFVFGLGFALGVLGNLLLALLAGVLYGLTMWRAIASLTIIDAALRALLVVSGLFAGAPETVLALFVALPFGTAAAVVWAVVRRRIAGAFIIDVSLRRLLGNTASTVVAALSTGTMVTGLPLLLQLAVSDAGPSLLASLILIITVTRAPLIIPLIALQSFLIVRFRHSGGRVRRLLAAYLGAAAVVTAVAATAAAAAGPAVVHVISGGAYKVSSLVAAGVLISAGLVAMMCLSGPALLSENRHRLFVAGWAVAALATVGALLLPYPPEMRVMVALIAGPLLGLAIHAGAVRPPNRATPLKAETA